MAKRRHLFVIIAASLGFGSIHGQEIKGVPETRTVAVYAWEYEPDRHLDGTPYANLERIKLYGVHGGFVGRLYKQSNSFGESDSGTGFEFESREKFGRTVKLLNRLEHCEKCVRSSESRFSDKSHVDFTLDLNTATVRAITFVPCWGCTSPDYVPVPAH